MDPRRDDRRPRPERGGGRRLAVPWVLATALLLPAPVRSMETDPFLPLDTELEDSADVVNAYASRIIRHRLSLYNDRNLVAGKSECDKIARFILKGFRALTLSRVARWAHTNPDVTLYPDDSVSRYNYYRQSILGVPYYYHFQVPLGRTLNIDGVYLGADKLGHFFSFGARYHRRFKRNVARGKSEEQAERDTILWGVGSERGIVGRWTTGIVSYADLEANYQGLRLARALCDPAAPTHLDRDEDDNWRLSRPLDIRDYVNPDWDEAYNPNVYIERRWKNIRERMRRHCPKLGDPRTVERWRRYDEIYRPSRNAEIVRELEREGKLPDRRRFTLAAVCADPGTDLKSVP